MKRRRASALFFLDLSRLFAYFMGFIIFTLNRDGTNMTWDWDKLKEQQGGAGGGPPNLDDLFKKFNKFKTPGGPFFVVLLVILAGLGSSIFYTIGVDEAGVVQRFGKFVRTSQRLVLLFQKIPICIVELQDDVAIGLLIVGQDLEKLIIDSVEHHPVLITRVMKIARLRRHIVHYDSFCFGGTVVIFVDIAS